MIEKWFNVFAGVVIGLTLLYGAWHAGRYYAVKEDLPSIEAALAQKEDYVRLGPDNHTPQMRISNVRFYAPVGDPDKCKCQCKGGV
ncbi:MAG: hypothetical protein HQL01_15630 [Nitrospirae bacterium]|nr:hypothetical protein [Nitrospirota bacterium]